MTVLDPSSVRRKNYFGKTFYWPKSGLNSVCILDRLSENPGPETLQRTVE